MTALHRLLTVTREAEVGGAPPAPAAPEAPPSRESLAGLFAAELAAEEAPAKPAPAPNEPAAPVEAAAAPETAEQQPADPATTEPESAPDEDRATPAIDAPSGMSEADKAMFAKLSPEAQAWVSKRAHESQADYTRKAQAVAEVRKQAEQMTAQLQGQLQQYDQILSTITGRNIAPPDPALRMSDPGAYEEQLAAYVQSRHAQEVATAEQTRVRAEMAKAQEEQKRAYFAEQSSELARIANEAGIPGLAAGTDEGRAMRKGVYDYGLKAGYTEDMLSMASAKDMLTLWKAQQYDAAKAAKTVAKPAPAPVPKSQTPGPAKQAPNKGSLTAAVQKVSQSGSREDLAASYLALLNSE